MLIIILWFSQGSLQITIWHTDHKRQKSGTKNSVSDQFTFSLKKMIALLTSGILCGHNYIWHIKCIPSKTQIFKFSLSFTESHNHRMLGVGRDLGGLSSPTPLPKQGHLHQAAQELVQAGLEYLQRRRLHHLPGQPVAVLGSGPMFSPAEQLRLCAAKRKRLNRLHKSLLQSPGFPLQAVKNGDMNFIGNVIFPMVTPGILNYTGCLPTPAVLSGWCSHVCLQPALADIVHGRPSMQTRLSRDEARIPTA